MNELDGKLEKWYESKTVYLISTLTPIVLILAFVFQMRTDIALIQQSINNINVNHEVHIQSILEEIKDLHTIQTSQQTEIIELQKTILLLKK